MYAALIVAAAAVDPMALVDTASGRWAEVLMDVSRSLGGSPEDRRQLLASVLERAQVLAQAGGKLSPQESTVIGEVLLPTVEEEIQPAILREFQTAQDLFNAKVDDLMIVSARTNFSLPVAVAADKRVDACRLLQKQRMGALEICSAQEQERLAGLQAACKAAQGEADLACKVLDDTSDQMKSQVQADLTASCEFAHAERQKISTLLDKFSALEATVQEKAQAHRGLRDKCGKRREVALTKCAVEEAGEDPCAPVREDVAASRQQCSRAVEAALLSKCEYGTALQGHCAGLDEITALQQRIQAPSRNDSLSEPDRQQEWVVVQNVTCLLEALRDQGDLGSAAIAACMAPRAYPRTFDFREADLAAVAGGGAACAGEVTFSGVSWATGETAAGFVRSEDHPEFDGDQRHPPFPFCAGQLGL
mmetsp:Transcript_2550/g.5932  ORF Transcript_2550/g.5932 Transcript_2550/m.5932 type:complete len:420 (+) Transcript_2550:80-1339(+)